MKKVKAIFLAVFICVFTVFSIKIFAENNFYVLPANNSIEFRMDGTGGFFIDGSENWPIKYDLGNNEYNIAPKIELRGEDIEGILIKKINTEEKHYTIINGKKKEIKSYCEDNPNQVLILFKKESWEKVRKMFEHNLGRKLALIKDDKVIFSARIISVISNYCLLSNIDLKTMEFLLHGLLKAEAPSEQQRDIEYHNWLLTKIDDFEYRSDLEAIANHDSSIGNYLEAIQIFEKLIAQYPDRKIDYLLLGKCYYKTGNFNKSIAFFLNLLELKLSIENEFFVRMELGNCLMLKNEKGLALIQLKKCINLIDGCDFTSKEKFKEFMKKKIEQIETELKQ